MPVIEKISPKIDVLFKEQFQTNVEEESQVVVHLSFKATDDMLIRIWPSTYLFPIHSNQICDLLFTENITLHPYWTEVKTGITHRFTLIFNGLPKGCKHFDLLEVIPESGGFEFKNIERNRADVYYLDIN